MAAAAELTALGRCWFWLLLGLQAVSGRSGEFALGAERGCGFLRETQRGWGGGAGVRRGPQREAGPALPWGAGWCLVPLLPCRPPLRSLLEGVLRFCPCRCLCSSRRREQRFGAGAASAAAPLRPVRSESGCCCDSFDKPIGFLEHFYGTCLLLPPS